MVKNDLKCQILGVLEFFAQKWHFWPLRWIFIFFGQSLGDNNDFNTKIIEIDQKFKFLLFFKEIGSFYQYLTRLWGTTLRKDLFFIYFFLLLGNFESK